MKKKIPVVFIIVLIAALCVSLWLYAYYSRKSNDNLPSKELVVSYYQNYGADYASEQLRGYKQPQLAEVWGAPDSFLSGMWGDIWKTNTAYALIVYYDGNGIVEHVKVINEKA